MTPKSETAVDGKGVPATGNAGYAPRSAEPASRDGAGFHAGAEASAPLAPPVLHAPINVRSTSLAILALLAVTAALDNALFWGCIGGVLHLIPYAGPTAFVRLVGLVAFAQFDSLQPVVLVIGTMLTAIGVIGLLIVPWLTQRVGRLNAVTVFVSLLVWGWLWGIWGLLLGIPIVMAINAVCERVEDLQPLSEFLGYVPREHG